MNNVFKLAVIIAAATGALALEAAAPAKTLRKPYGELTTAIKEGDLKKVQSIVPSQISADKVLKQTDDQIKKNFKPESVLDFAIRYQQHATSTDRQRKLAAIVDHLRNSNTPSQSQQKSKVASSSSSSSSSSAGALSTRPSTHRTASAAAVSAPAPKKAADEVPKVESIIDRLARGIRENEIELLINDQLKRTINPALFSDTKIALIEQLPVIGVNNGVARVIKHEGGFQVNAYQYAKYLYDEPSQSAEQKKQRKELLDLIAKGIPAAQRVAMEKELKEKLEKNSALYK